MFCTRKDCDLIQEPADNNKTDHCDTTEILLKVALNTKTLSLKVAQHWIVSDNQCCVFLSLTIYCTL